MTIRRILFAAVLVLLATSDADLWGFPRGGGGGGRGGGGGGGGGARPAAHPTPSFSGGSNISRPAGGGGGGGGARPGLVPQPRPTPLPARPGGGGGGINLGGGGAGRPPIGGGGGGINLGGGGAGRPPIGGGGDRPINIGGGGGINNGGNRPINIGGGGGINNGGNRPIGGGGGINNGGINIGGGGDRPINIGGGGGNVIRPGGGNNNNIINRPNSGNTNINNRPINVNNNNFNNANINRNNNFYRPYNNWHNGWTHGYWNYWPRWPVGFVGGATLGWLLAPGDSFVYSNPYYVQQTTVVQPVIDYSQPIPPPPPPPPVAPADGDAPAADGAPAVPQEAIQALDSARAAFKKGDYASAQQLTEKALKLVPSDATLHEFRALTLFAQKKFQEAAAAVYAVLVTGPGWDWDTLKALYPDVATYTTQLRALEDYVKQNPNQADARFLLAYHYLAMGYPDSAAKQLTEVVKLQPKDQLSAELLKSLQKNSNDKPTVGQ